MYEPVFILKIASLARKALFQLTRKGNCRRDHVLKYQTGVHMNQLSDVSLGFRRVSINIELEYILHHLHCIRLIDTG